MLSGNGGPHVVYPQYWGVDDWSQLFFQLQPPGRISIPGAGLQCRPEAQHSTWSPVLPGQRRAGTYGRWA